jgi:hypothetical protein
VAQATWIYGTPKENVPDKVKSVFKPIATKLPGVQFTGNLPKLSLVNDRFTMIRSMSYTPNGLFNHTAAIYQMMTGLYDRQGQPIGAAGAAHAQRTFPNYRVRTSSSLQARRRSRCCRS